MVKAMQEMSLECWMVYILHSDIQNVGERNYKCKCCGLSWRESITSPQVLTDEQAKNLYEYYPKERVRVCTEL